MRLLLYTMRKRGFGVILLSLACLSACYHYSDVEQDIGGSSYRMTSSAFLDSLAGNSVDSTYEVWWESSFGKGEVKFRVWKNSNVLFVEFLGCKTYKCLDAKKVVVYDENYRYAKVFYPDQFKITVPKEKFFDGHGDCDIRKDLFFDVVIDQEDFKIDWTVKYGAVTCEEFVYDGIPTDWSPGW